MRSRIPAALVAAMALALAACGGDGGTGSTQPTGSPTTTATTSATPSATAAALNLPDLKGTTLEVTAEWQKDEQKRFRQVLDEFEKLTGATVKYTSTGSDTATILGGRVDGGNPPDVAMIAQPGLIEQLVERKAAKPLPADVQTFVQANYSPVWQELGTFDGQMHAVFFKAANKSTVWYRPDAFQAAGVTEPQTWEDFTAALGTIRDSGVTPLSVGGADGWTLTDWFENVYLRTAGPDKYDQLTDHEIPWTDESVTKALQLLADVWKDKTLLAPNPLQTSFPESVTQVFGANNKAAVVYEGDFVAGTITGSTQAKVGTDAKFFPFPAIAGSAPSVVGGGDAAVMMKDSKGAQALMQFFASAEAAEIWVELGGFTSPNKAVSLDNYPDDTSRSIAEQLVNAEVFKFDMSDLTPSQFGGTPGRGMWKALQDFLRNPAAVTQTANQLESAAKAAYK